MPALLTGAIVTITLALVFYTIGVWSERIQGILKKKHLIFFWLGLCMDTAGTTMMSKIADGSGGALMSAHGITGLIAIILMFIHAIWASVVLAKKNEEASRKFHRFSILVWVIWLIPYMLGMMMGMRG